MAYKKTLAQRLFNISKISEQFLTKCRISSSSLAARVPPNTNTANIAHDPGDHVVFRCFLHKKAVSQPAISPELRELAAGGNMVEKFKSLGIAPHRIRLDCLRPPACDSLASDPDRSDLKGGLTVEDARKLLRVARMEMVKRKLREVQKSWIPHSEFVRICGQGCDDPGQGLETAQMLDESGTVIVLGNVVYLRPEQVAKAIEGLIPLPPVIPNDDARREELEEMETKKAVIDKKAEMLVRRELWVGLGLLVAQTAAFMRLTFWELTWDVMEPICFYVTSAYFIAGYTFFLKTSKEPSFEGFFQSRFSTKQKRLMKLQNFDIARYNELCKACPPKSSAQGLPSSDSKVYELESLHH
ncbi:calcium uniporter protein 2, mitochondrial-like [Cucurbita maxima]|uniref:Calcium uniporter protein 2, mitochondrial-like n=1 Tax=Cucurbita maxima TaxID=3661 RepID=A0A6J1I7N3_CUCMA|nr:calcium uniporter protein 2, mitochondrial-like [Cucurbita maxima]